MDRREFFAGGVLAAAAIAMQPSAAMAEGATGPQGLFDVKSFGALGNGVADDTAAIRAAIDAARAAAGGVVWFPAGVYLTGTLTLPGAVTLAGTGWQSKLRLAPGTDGPVITTAASTTTWYPAIADLAVDGNRSVNTSANCHGIVLWGADHARISGVRVTNCAGNGIHGAGDAANGTIAPYITSCYIDSCQGHGMALSSYTYDVKAHGVDIGLCNKGVILSNSSFFVDVSVWQCTTGLYGYWATRTHMVNCRAERCSNYGFWLDGCTDVMIEACRAYENNQAVGGSYSGIHVSGNLAKPSKRVSVVGCHSGITGSSYEKQRYGITAHATYAESLIVSNCIAQGNVTGGYSLPASAVTACNL